MQIIFVLLLLPVFVLGDSYIDYKSPFHPTITDKGVVVSQNFESSAIGVQILDAGGNAVDAAVAVGFSLAITLPRAGNLGGGGFMLIYLEDSKEIFSIDYRSSSSKNANLQFLFGTQNPSNLKNIDYSKTTYGYSASATPGTVYGLLEAHEKFGKLPLSEVLNPVIEQAERGIKVSYDLHHSIGSAEQLLMDPESKRIFFRNNNPLPVGSIMQRPDLAKTIKAIVEKGKDGFYKGWVAEAFSSAMKTNRGFIDKNDLLNYKSTFRDPIGTNYRGYKVFTQAPPSGGGITFITALNILQFFNLEKYGPNSAATYHLLAEALRRGHNNRSHHVGDPAYYNVPLNELISIRRAKMLAENINFKAATISKSIQSFEIEESKDTTHYSIVDADGNAVSNTYTLGYSFGSGVTIPGTGILMNNQMRNFAYLYGKKGVTGRAASPGNKFEPGKKPMSTMHPIIVFDKNDNLFLVTGSPGGSQIPAANLRIVTGVIDFKLNVADATMLPRIHKDWPYKELEYESLISSDSYRVLDKLGHYMELSDTIGSTQSIQIIDETRYGFADLRRPNAGVSIQ